SSAGPPPTPRDAVPVEHLGAFVTRRSEPMASNRVGRNPRWGRRVELRTPDGRRRTTPGGTGRRTVRTQFGCRAVRSPQDVPGVGVVDDVLPGTVRLTANNFGRDGNLRFFARNLEPPPAVDQGQVTNDQFGGRLDGDRSLHVHEGLNAAAQVSTLLNGRSRLQQEERAILVHREKTLGVTRVYVLRGLYCPLLWLGR